MPNKIKVIYIGPFSFPNGGAAARRILGNALALKEAGAEVVIASGQMPDNASKNGEAVESEYKGLKVVSLGERTAEKYPRYLKHLLYFGMGSKSVAWLDQLPEKPDAVILYSGYSPYMMRLIPWCKKHGVKFVFDAVEWYDPKSFLHGLLSPYQWNIELALRYYSRKTDAVIAISTFLERHYASKGCETVRVPPTLDMKEVEPNLEPENERLVLSYTGTPGNKDLFNAYLEAVLQLHEEGNDLQFSFAGVTKEQLMQFEAMEKRKITLESIPSVLDCRGVTSQHEAMMLTRNADFSLLLRRPERYAQAGFPTKVVESLSMGTPVICNITSDLGAYIREGKEGFICSDHSIDALKKSIQKALHLSMEKKRKMRYAARKQAESAFDCYQYSEDIASLLVRK